MTLYLKLIYFAFIYLILNNKWVLVQSSESSPANPNEAKKSTNPPEDGGSSATPPASSAGDGSTVKTGQGGTATPTADGSSESSKKTGVELSLKATKATPQFEYNKNGNIVTFTAKDTFGFSSVKSKKGGSCGSGGTDFTIWDAKDASEYATKVVLDGKGKKEKEVTIHKLDNHKVICVKEGKNKPWQSFDLSKTNTVSINIGFTSDSFKYTNKLEGETRTFEAKDNFIFNHARCYINKDWIDIWKTDNENEYSKKVMVEGDAKVTIHLKNGGTKVFVKGSDDKWTEDTQASTQKSTTDGSGGGTTPATPTSGGTTGTGTSGGAKPADGSSPASTPATQ